MPQVSDTDVAVIREWLGKEPTLPKDLEDTMLKKFLFSCHCSLERTKKCIEDFCITRATMNEIYTNRDPLSAKLKTAFNITNVGTYDAGVDEIVIHRLIDTDKFDFYDCLKSFTVQSDEWLRLEREVLPENQIVILDIKLYTLMLVAKANIFYFQKFVLFLLNAMPVRLKEVHVINCPSFYEYLYGLVKGALPQNIQDIMHFHSDHMGVHKFIDKKYLPSEYDGDAESMVEQGSKWMKETIQNRSFYLNDNLWKADISQKGKNGTEDTTMSGSFRTLAID